MKKIKEIFLSLQGEGRNTGRAAVFIRLSGCNLRCPFCDTDFQGGTDMTDEAIAEAVKACCPAWAELPLIVLTGGEPTLQVDSEFLRYLHTTFPKAQLAMETNGTRPVPEGVDWITCSPKHEDVALTQAQEVKVVYPGTVPPEWALQIQADYYYLQPCDTGNPQETRRNIDACVRYVQQHPRWTLSLQTHKLIDIQ